MNLPTRDDPLAALQLHMTLNDIEPPIWRRFNPEFMARQRDEARVRARKLLPLEGDSITYEYDFGHFLRHLACRSELLQRKPFRSSLWRDWTSD